MAEKIADIVTSLIDLLKKKIMISQYITRMNYVTDTYWKMYLKLYT